MFFARSFLPQKPSYSGLQECLDKYGEEEYSTLFMHASVIQGFFSGIIAGADGSESPFDGLKAFYGFMMTTAYIFFCGVRLGDVMSYSI